TFALNTYTINATAGSGGIVTPAGITTVNCGASQSYTITPDPGFVIASVVIDGINDLPAVSGGTYAFNTVSANHTINATFVLSTGPIVVEADPALVSIDMSDLSNVTANPNLIPYHASRRIHIPVLNLTVDPNQ